MPEQSAVRERRTTGTLVMRTLAGYGIDVVFGIPGTHNLEFYRPLAGLGLRPVTTRHEQGAAYAADAWSQRTGHPGVVVTTSGPGLLNALSGAATSFAQSRPLLLIAPGPARGAEFADVGTLHETRDQFSAATAVVGWGRRVVTANEAVEAIHDAFAFFASQRARPVYLEVPLDLLEEEIGESSVPDAALAPRAVGSPAAADASAVGQAARLLAAAERPVILAGGGSRGAASAIRTLAERLAAPVVTTTSAKGVLDETHPLALGSSLRLGPAREVARTADVLLVIGTKLGDAELWVDRLDAQGSVIRVDLSEEQLQKNQAAEVGLRADASVVVGQLCEALGDGPADAARTEEAAQRVARVHQETVEASRAMTPGSAAVAEAIAAALPPEAIVATDSSQVGYRALDVALSCREPDTFLYMATYATLGYGLPAGLGAAIADPERPAYVVTGDGALMFSVNEMVTVTEQGASVTVIVVDNGGYAEIKQNEVDLGIAPVGVDLVQPDWPALAAAFLGHGVHVTSVGELAAALDAAREAGGLQLIHLHESDFLGDSSSSSEVA